MSAERMNLRHRPDQFGYPLSSVGLLPMISTVAVWREEPWSRWLKRHYNFSRVYSGESVRRSSVGRPDPLPKHLFFTQTNERVAWLVQASTSPRRRNRTMGFNPPPGWPIPRGWQPPPGWQPDPTWPPAPPGWHFWTDGPGPLNPVAPQARVSLRKSPLQKQAPLFPAADEAPPFSPQQPQSWLRRPAALLVIGALVIVAALGGGYLLVQRLTGSSDSGGAVAGQLRGSFPVKPTADWVLPSDSVYDRAQLVRPDPTSHQYSRPGFIDLGDTLITAAIQPNTDREATIVAVSAALGSIMWKSADVGFKPVCASATIDGLLPCLGKIAAFGPPGSAPPPYVYFLRMADGSIDHKLEVPENTRAVEVEGSAVYTMGYDADRSARFITRGTAGDLTADWRKSYPISDNGACPGSGDTLIDGVTAGVVFSGNDSGVVAARVGDGNQLFPTPVTELEIFAHQGLIGRVCNGGDPNDVDTIIADSDGTILRTVQDTTWAAEPWLVNPAEKVPYVIGRSAFDFASGEKLWTAPDGGGSDLRTMIGDTVLGGGLRGGPLAALDLATGQQLWTRDDLDDAEWRLSDGRRVMVATGDGLQAVDLGSGRTEWTLPGIDSRHFIGAAGLGFAYSTNDAITYYGPTGGPSAAPGRGADTPASETGDNRPITKCGRTPEMRPVSYRAENGALVVIMEVKARCPDGDIVSTDRLRVTIRDHLGRICSGVFDFSQDPLILGREGSEPIIVELTFERGTFTRHPNTIGGQRGAPPDSGTVVTESNASGTEIVDCSDEGTSYGPDSSDGPRSTGGGAISKGQERADCGSDADTLDALRTQADADRPFVRSSLADRWVAQLSSKRPGLVAPDVDGLMVTWTPCEILQQHLRMRGQYPEVRLVWSDEWRTFDLAGWWVTVAGVTFPDADAANDWCDTRAIPVDECYAKVVSDSRDSQGSTKYRR